MLCYKNQGIHWYPCHPTFLWTINFRLEWRLISAFIWDISGLGNPSDGRDFREILIDMSRFLTPYIFIYLSIIYTPHVGRKCEYEFIIYNSFLKWYLRWNLMKTPWKSGQIFGPKFWAARSHCGMPGINKRRALPHQPNKKWPLISKIV